MAVIKINGNTLDPQAPTLRALGLHCDDASNSNYILLQIPTPLTAEIKKELEDKKVVIHQKVSQDTYLCGYKPSVCSPSPMLTVLSDHSIESGKTQRPFIRDLCKYIPAIFHSASKSQI
jgi:hypothetical protein